MICSLLECDLNLAQLVWSKHVFWVNDVSVPDIWGPTVNP
jgi:hypothetical protein